MANPLRTSDGTHESRDAVLIELTSSDGLVGWGENVAPSGVSYVGQSASDSYDVMRNVLVPILVNEEVFVADMFSQWWGVEGATFAKHALESAVWDIHARSLSMSLAQCLVAERDSIEVGVVVGMHPSIDDVVREVMLRIDEGYSRVKIKIGPGADREVLAAVRSAVGDSFALQADANGAYSASDIDHLVSLDEFALQFIEQPFAADDLSSHAELAHRSFTSVCLDESVNSLADFLKAVDAGACDVINVKPSRVGGIREAVAIHDAAVDRGIDAWVGGMLESGIGRAACLALAGMPGFTLTPDLSASNRYFTSDITEPFVLVDGEIALPTGLGIGVVPRAELLAQYADQIETLFER